MKKCFSFAIKIITSSAILLMLLGLNSENHERSHSLIGRVPPQINQSIYNYLLRKFFLDVQNGIIRTTDGSSLLLTEYIVPLLTKIKVDPLSDASLYLTRYRLAQNGNRVLSFQGKAEMIANYGSDNFYIDGDFLFDLDTDFKLNIKGYLKAPHNIEVIRFLNDNILPALKWDYPLLHIVSDQVGQNYNLWIFNEAKVLTNGFGSLNLKLTESQLTSEVFFDLTIYFSNLLDLKGRVAKNVGHYITAKDPLNLFSKHHDIKVSTDEGIIDLIRNARRQIKVAIYQMTDENLQKEIIHAMQTRGLKVAILAEKNPINRCGPFKKDAKDKVHRPIIGPDGKVVCIGDYPFKELFLINGGELAYFNNKKQSCSSTAPIKRCMHHGKMMIIDDKKALISTGNFNPSSFAKLPEAHSGNNFGLAQSYANRDYQIITQDQQAIETLTRMFELDFNGASFEEVKAFLYDYPNSNVTIAPYNSAVKIKKIIANAKKNLKIEMQSLKHPGIVDAIIAAMQKDPKGKLDVTIIVKDPCKYGVNRATYRQLCRLKDNGATILAFTCDNEINGLKGYMHAKMVLADGQKAWVGSQNFTGGIGSHREYGLIITDPLNIDLLEFYFNQDRRRQYTVSYFSRANSNAYRCRGSYECPQN